MSRRSLLFSSALGKSEGTRTRKRRGRRHKMMGRLALSVCIQRYLHQQHINSHLKRYPWSVLGNIEYRYTGILLVEWRDRK